jgi:hypothetical protein
MAPYDCRFYPTIANGNFLYIVLAVVRMMKGLTTIRVNYETTNELRP